MSTTLAVSESPGHLGKGRCVVDCQRKQSAYYTYECARLQIREKPAALETISLALTGPKTCFLQEPEGWTTNAGPWTITDVTAVHKHNLTFRTSIHISFSVSPVTGLCISLAIRSFFLHLTTSSMTHKHIHAYILLIT